MDKYTEKRRDNYKNKQKINSLNSPSVAKISFVQKFQKQNKGDCLRKIYREDLKMFVDKYKKERSFFRKFRRLPPEIYFMKLLSENEAPKQESSLFKNTNTNMNKNALSDVEKSLLLKMIAQNKSDREELNKIRWRDKIIDRLIEYFELEHKADKLTHLTDYF